MEGRRQVMIHQPAQAANLSESNQKNINFDNILIDSGFKIIQIVMTACGTLLPSEHAHLIE